MERKKDGDMDKMLFERDRENVFEMQKEIEEHAGREVWRRKLSVREMELDPEEIKGRK